MTKKITAILLALCMAISILPMSVQAASKPDIKVGDYVKMGTYNNASILWRCVSIDDNGPLMLADRIIDTLAYDAKTNDNGNSKSHSRSYKPLPSALLFLIRNTTRASLRETQIRICYIIPIF